MLKRLVWGGKGLAVRPTVSDSECPFASAVTSPPPCLSVLIVIMGRVSHAFEGASEGHRQFHLGLCGLLWGVQTAGQLKSTKEVGMDGQ